MIRLVWQGGDRFRLEKNGGLPPEPAPGQVVVRVNAVGICGTDIHILSGKLALARPPLVLGHEIAGVVTEIGRQVRRVRVGERVTVDQVVGCGECFFCRRGSRQFCEAGFELGITRDGGCQEFVVVPEENVYGLPDSISDEEAAILDMEVWAALKKCAIRPDDTVLVLGHGPAGMVASQIARALGAGKVILQGRPGPRLDKAQALCLADHYVHAGRGDLLEVIRRETGGRGVDVAIECAGTPETITDALASVIPGGRVVLYGVHTASLEQFDLNRIVLKDLTVYGALSDRTGWEEVIALVQSGRLRLQPLITHRFTLDCAPAAYDLVRRKANGVVKAVLVL